MTKGRAELREPTQPCHLAVSVTDGKDVNGNSNPAEDDSIEVTVTNVNELPAFDASAPTSLKVVENTEGGENIDGPITAIAPYGDTLTYPLDGTDAASFGIAPETGQLQTKAALDYETKTSYSVDVTATDRQGATDTIRVTINVTDVSGLRAEEISLHFKCPSAGQVTAWMRATTSRSGLPYRLRLTSR